MRVDEALKKAAHHLQAHSPSARLDAEVLLGWVLGVSKAGLISRLYDSLSLDSMNQFWELVERRAQSEPLAYIRGHQEFYGRDFIVTPSVLIPRPETEHLVEFCLSRCASTRKHIRILDLGTGSGCISVTLACELATRSIPFSISAVDVSPAALEVARDNAKRHGVENNIRFLHGSWYQPLSEEDVFEYIVSNPPYVPREADNRSPETDYEPEEALFHQQETLGSYREISATCDRHLASGAYLAVEHGQGQSDAIRDLFHTAPIGKSLFTSGIIRDLAGIERIFFLERDSF